MKEVRRAASAALLFLKINRRFKLAWDSKARIFEQLVLGLTLRKRFVIDSVISGEKSSRHLRKKNIVLFLAKPQVRLVNSRLGLHRKNMGSRLGDLFMEP